MTMKSWVLGQIWLDCTFHISCKASRWIWCGWIRVAMFSKDKFRFIKRHNLTKFLFQNVTFLESVPYKILYKFFFSLICSSVIWRAVFDFGLCFFVCFFKILLPLRDCFTKSSTANQKRMPCAEEIKMGPLFLVCICFVRLHFTITHR